MVDWQDLQGRLGQAGEVGELAGGGRELEAAGVGSDGDGEHWLGVCAHRLAVGGDGRGVTDLGREVGEQEDGGVVLGELSEAGERGDRRGGAGAGRRDLVVLALERLRERPGPGEEFGKAAKRVLAGALLFRVAGAVSEGQVRGHLEREQLLELSVGEVERGHRQCVVRHRSSRTPLSHAARHCSAPTCAEATNSRSRGPCLPWRLRYALACTTR